MPMNFGCQPKFVGLSMDHACPTGRSVAELRCPVFGRKRHETVSCCEKGTRLSTWGISFRPTKTRVRLAWKTWSASRIFRELRMSAERRVSSWEDSGHTTFAFIKSYVIKRGFLDGYEGLYGSGERRNHVGTKYAPYEAIISVLPW